MIRRPPRSTRTDTLFPYTTLFRSAAAQYALRVAGVQCKAVETGGIGKHAQRNQMRFGETVLIDHQAHRAGLRVLQRQLHFNDAGFHRFPFGLQLLAVRIAQHDVVDARSEEHTSELQSLMRISYAVFCLKKKKKTNKYINLYNNNNNKKNNKAKQKYTTINTCYKKLHAINKKILSTPDNKTYNK